MDSDIDNVNTDLSLVNSYKQYKKLGNCKRFRYFFKMMDMYAIPVTLRYKN
jgi:hypothetical protein